MNLIILPNEVLENILLYLPYHNKILINKKNYINAIKIFKDNILKIQKFYIKSINRIKETQELTNSNDTLIHLNKKDIQTYYILYYPEKFKKEFMKLTLTKIVPLNYNKLNQIYHDNNLTLNRKFMIFMRLLQINEMAYVGW